MFDDLPGMIAELDAQARSSAHDRDHSEHVLYTNKGDPPALEVEHTRRIR
jgi:hypothetical protein